jgi:hypothetical protein
LLFCQKLFCQKLFCQQIKLRLSFTPTEVISRGDKLFSRPSFRYWSRLDC